MMFAYFFSWKWDHINIKVEALLPQFCHNVWENLACHLSCYFSSMVPLDQDLLSYCIHQVIQVFHLVTLDLVVEAFSQIIYDIVHFGVCGKLTPSP